MQKRTVTIQLFFTKDGIDPRGGADVKTNDVPVSLILESLNNLTRGLAEGLVREAYADGITDPEEQEAYLQGLINLDREKLKSLFK